MTIPDDGFEVVPSGTRNLLRRIQFAVDLPTMKERKIYLDALEPELKRLVERYLGRDLEEGALRPIIPRARDQGHEPA